MTQFRSVGLMAGGQRRGLETCCTCATCCARAACAWSWSASGRPPGPAARRGTGARGHRARHRLVIVVGGDGSLLGAARSLAPQNAPVLGVNRGRLGFLTDISPQQLEAQIDEVLAGAT